MRQSLVRKAVIRGSISFCTAGMVNVIIMLIVCFIQSDQDYVPMLEEFWKQFPSQSAAILTEILLIGTIGAAFGACSVIFELERWSFLKQGIVHFILTTIVWLPISIFIWAVYIHPSAIISMTASYSFTYAVTWISNAVRLKKMVKEINNMLE